MFIMCDRSCKIHESCNFVTDVEDEFRSEFEEKIDESEHKMMSLNGKLQLWPDNCPLNRPAPQGESDVFPFNFLQRSSFIQLTIVQSESQFQTLIARLICGSYIFWIQRKSEWKIMSCID